MRYHLIVIGEPYTDAWWLRHLSMGFISAGFQNAPGDRGERILRELAEGDWIVAYANKYGAVGAGKVGNEGSYRLARSKKLPSSFESSHRHLRDVSWIFQVKSLADGIPYRELGLKFKRMQTKQQLDPGTARRIIDMVKKRSSRLADDEAEQSEESNDRYVPHDGDWRTVVERQIRERRGQQQFRDSIRKRYGNRCLVTGCQILALLEAAHIKPYRGINDNNPENGLLLRADIHTLFDLNLLGIQPTTLRLELHPSLGADDAYRGIIGQRIVCPTGKRPSRKALELRYKEFRARA